MTLLGSDGMSVFKELLSSFVFRSLPSLIKVTVSTLVFFDGLLDIFEEKGKLLQDLAYFVVNRST